MHVPYIFLSEWTGRVVRAVYLVVFQRCGGNEVYRSGSMGGARTAQVAVARACIVNSYGSVGVSHMPPAV